MNNNFTIFKNLIVFISLSLLVTVGFSQPNKQYSKLFPSDHVSSDFFGGAIDIDDTLLVIGTKQKKNGSAVNAGAVYIFKKNAFTYVEHSKITPSDYGMYDMFGSAVSINDTNIIVGSPNKISYRGRAYIYTYNGSWTELKLMPSLNDYDRFGSSVAICDSFAVVSAPYDDDAASNAGAVYLYNYNENTKTWDFQTKIIAPDAEGGEYFGVSVEITNKYLYVGAEEYNGSGTYRGKVYIYKYQSGSWSLDHSLEPDAVDNARFGNSIAVYDSTIVVGARTETNTNGSSAGNVYIFRKTSSWNQIVKLKASKGTNNDQFGRDVTIFGDTIVVSKYDDAGNRPGAAYVFIDSSGTWVERDIIEGSPAVNGDNFGISLALWKDNLLVGSPLDDESIGDGGAVYNFLPVPTLWQQPQDLLDQCSNGNGDLSLLGYNIDSVHWQISQSSSAFSNLTNNSQYSGVINNDINIVYEMTIDSAKYRSMLYNKYFQIPSDTAMLTFEKDVPIPNAADLDTIFGQCSATVTVYPTANDVCESSIIATTDSSLTYNEQGKDTIVWVYTDPNGNFSTQNQIVIIEDDTKPEVTCSADTIFVMANSSGDYAVSDGEFVPNFTDNCSTVNITNNYNGESSLNDSVFGIDTLNIIWTGTDLEGNSINCETIIVIEEFHVDLKDINLQVEIFPNPASNFIYLNVFNNTTVSVKIYSADGTIVYTDKIYNSAEIDLSNFNRGIYFIELKSNEKVAYKKIVIEK